ncbi:phytoene dehydrogenase [Halobiforma lacisalsi AJ5]|uniref:Phytoene dehydrogenase n=2 Tax=Natronobacterium lacisalsi AJ5 TaxID=358396 RepID=A0A1P8LSH7_NATLA|nr:phytoene desaturase family protein [Halobiforma lacisalsi]APW98747.1 phytoene dehydrogenase [Halobiforma lacisalsi AJ5]
MSDLTDDSIAVAGAGFGGLAAAAYLAAAGADVTVYERRTEVGGVAGRLTGEGFRFDTGPSWYLMPELFDRFFADFGREPSDYYDLERLDPNYRVFWEDGDRADVPADPAEAGALFESYSPGAGEALERYLTDAREAYEIGMNRFVLPNRTRFRDYLSTDVLRSARGLALLGTMDDHVADYFDHPKLRQLVQYTLVFLGGAPHNTPALYTLMSHVDYGLGVYYPQGGMREVVDAVAAVAREQGATIETGTPIDALEPTPNGFAVTTDAGRVRHDRVVCNAPPAHVERDLLPAGVPDRPDDYWDDRTYAPSAFMLYLGVDGEPPEFEHHTLVLPTDWTPHFESIFDDPAWPDDPAYYVNVPSRTDPSVAPDGCETVVILVPIAPGLEDDDATRERFRDAVLADLAETTGVDLRERIRFEERACVSEFAGGFNKPQGTALGLAHTLRQTGPLRPRHRVPGLEGLYYVGGDTNPGIGVPMCLLSGEHVTEAVLADARDGPVDRGRSGNGLRRLLRQGLYRVQSSL